ncbi:oleate hydratase [Rhizobium sp. 22-785-1]
MIKFQTNPTSVSRSDRSSIKAYLVGGGIASLASAAFLIRDGDLLGHNITILEELDTLGGSLDGSGSPEAGYVLRGGRMLESKYLCTFDLFSSIPTLNGDVSVTEEIFAWNKTMRTSSKSRIFRDGHRLTAPAFGLREKHILTIERLALEPEKLLGRSTIADQFDADFFKTDFWFMWCTTFAFQQWHSAVEFKRYLVRFAHMVSGFQRLEGIMRTPLNQYDSMVRPLVKWLEERGVNFQTNTRVTDLEFGGKSVRRILFECDGKADEIAVLPNDLVIATLGSMTEGSSIGSMDTVPVLNTRLHGGAWTLWDKLAVDRPEFGRPDVFCGHIDSSKWVSFTTTLRDDAFLKLVRDLTGNVPGEGGLVTFSDSAWLASIVIPSQPHFIDQPKNASVFWGYGLAVDEPGDFVSKPMSACTGREIMTEIIGHLRLKALSATLLNDAICIPCMMPFITSQFLPRQAGDRPEIIPDGYTNLAFTGQFCELPDDVVFTVEYSIRSAQTAVSRMLGLKRTAPPVYKGQFDPKVIYEAFRALHGMAA